jgi:hypothetical protein
MCEFLVEFHRPQAYVLTPHGLFILANAKAIVPGRMHLIRYNLFDQFATIVAIALAAS